MSQSLTEEPATLSAPPVGGTRGITSSLALTFARGAVPVGPAAAQRWLPIVVLGLAVACGIGVYAHFWQHSRELWWWMGHDRHTHYMFGLNLAFDVRTFDLVSLLHDFDRMRVWGPLHPMLVGAIALVAGPDHRLAVLPSLCGYILAIWFAFLIPRRLMATGGSAAGSIAACMVAASPAHRAFAGDVMLESFGAGLSLAVIYLYIVVLQEQSRRFAMLLGVALTALFLHKSNYWLLVVFGLAVGEFARQPTAWVRYARARFQRERLTAWLGTELKQPSNYIALAFALAALAVLATGGGTITLGRWSMSAQTPHNFLQLAFIALCLRGAWWWWKHGRTWTLQAMPTTLRTVLIWHVSAVAVWFALPKRLGYFLWYVSPYDSDQQRDSIGFMHGLPTYLNGLQEDYLPLSGGIYLFVGMVALGVFVMAAGLIRRQLLNPGSGALLCFFLIAAYLTCQHPMLKHRFMHSWIAAGWIIGAIGLVYCAQALAGMIGQPWRGRVAILVSALLIALHGPAFLQPGHAQEGGLKPNEPSPLRITDTYLPALAEFKNPTIVSNVSTRFLWTWTFIETHHHQNMAAEIKNFKAFDGNPEPARQWLQATKSDALVLIDIRRFSAFDWKTDEYVDLAAFHQALAGQSEWIEARHWDMPEGVSITLWRRK